MTNRVPSTIGEAWAQLRRRFRRAIAEWLVVRLVDFLDDTPADEQLLGDLFDWVQASGSGRHVRRGRR